jgi:ABC-2 type transport system permease protein
VSRRRLLAVVVKELRQLLRDPRTLISVLLLPIVQLILYGYLSNEVLGQPMIVLDQSLTAESRALIRAFQDSRYFRIHRAARRLAEIDQALDAGADRVGLVIPPDYARYVRAGMPVAVLVVVDAADATSARILMATASGIGATFSQQAQALKLGRSGAQLMAPYLFPPGGQAGVLIDVRTRAWYNPNLESQLFIVPGVLAIILQFISTFMSVSVIVRERELGTLEQLVVTPIQRGELLLGKIVPLLLLAYVNLTFILGLAWLWFDVEVRGSLLLLYLLSLAFFFSTLGMGTLISTVSRTFQQATQLSQLVLLPSMLLSGFLFPRDTLPPLLQWVGLCLPLTHFVVVVRGIIVKGVGVDYLWPQIVALLGLGIVVFGWAVARFEKRID